VNPTNPINVLFDPQIFLLQRQGGISRYFAEIIKEFQSNPELGIRPLLETKSVLSEHALTELDSFNLKRVSSVKSALFSLAALILGKSKQNSDTAQLIHHTFYLPWFLGRHKLTPRAVTLFDMIPENTPRELRLWNPHFVKQSYVRRASLVLSISDSSTKDMLREYKLSLDVPTTYLGVSADFKPGLPRPDSKAHSYFLYVGNRGGYKDCLTATEAFSKVAKVNANTRLLLVGGGGLKRSERKLLKRLGLSNRVEQISVSNEALPSYYSNALALLYPTRYEGFGLPLVEAMASGIPILASDIEINHEICEDAATYFSVGDSERLASQMQQVLTDPQVVSDKIKLGLTRAQDFTWAKCAQKTAIAYRALLENLQGKQK
jgi:glycosyltransferase involved in cell wall biosynthesis